jgi:hypothetical protein
MENSLLTFTGCLHGKTTFYTYNMRRRILKLIKTLLPCRTDLHCANALSEKPLFRPLSYPSPEVPIDQVFSALGPDITESSALDENPHLVEFPIGRYSLDSTLKHIQDLSATLELIRISPVLPEENVRYSDKVYYLQNCLLAIIHSPDYGPLDTVFSIAALLFCCACFRDVNFNFRVVADGVTRLQKALEAFETDHSLVDAAHSNRLFWAITLGAMAAEGKQERPWLAKRMRIVGAVLNVDRWESAKGILEDILWQSQLDCFGSQLWREALD